MSHVNWARRRQKIRLIDSEVTVWSSTIDDMGIRGTVLNLVQLSVLRMGSLTPEDAQD
jgi:hypothetical protein